MTSKILYCSVTNTTGINSVTINDSHDTTIATAMISAVNTTLTLGSVVTIDMGYSTGHAQLFSGYVKNIERVFQDSSYNITASNVMIRGSDYFLVSDSPETPYTNRNMSAEALVRALLQMAGLAGSGKWSEDATSFVFGVDHDFEINLVTVGDYCRAIADTLTWNLWADASEVVHFENRKPFVMTGDSGQIGDIADVPLADFTLTDVISVDEAYSKTEKNLRNKVVVYGDNSISAIASAEVNSLPAGFYKSVVFAMPGLITDTATAQKIADYNLYYLARITEAIRVTIVGDIRLTPRIVVTADLDKLNLTGDWYVFGCQHNLSRSGYTTSLDLRRMTDDRK